MRDGRHCARVQVVLAIPGTLLSVAQARFNVLILYVL